MIAHKNNYLIEEMKNEFTKMYYCELKSLIENETTTIKTFLAMELLGTACMHFKGTQEEVHIVEQLNEQFLAFFDPLINDNTDLYSLFPINELMQIVNTIDSYEIIISDDILISQNLNNFIQAFYAVNEFLKEILTDELNTI